MQTRTYADILDRIEALSGKDTFSTEEQTRLLSLVNARWFRAYSASEYWPRYIIVGEQRAFDQTTNAVPFSADSAVLVSGAGTEDANGLYFPVGVASGKTLYGIDGDADSFAIQWNNGSFWEIVDSEGGPLYSNSGGTSPWTNDDYSEESGISPAPTVTESPRADIDSFMRLTSAAPYGAGPACGYEVDFYVANDGAHPISIPLSGFTTLWVTYKAEWGGPYAADTTAVPIEFFEYIAHGAFSDWLRSTGQSLPQAQAEDSIAQEMLNYEMLKSQSRANAQVNNQRFSTYISNQPRLSY